MSTHFCSPYFCWNYLSAQVLYGGSSSPQLLLFIIHTTYKPPSKFKGTFSFRVTVLSTCHKPLLYRKPCWMGIYVKQMLGDLRLLRTYCTPHNSWQKLGMVDGFPIIQPTGKYRDLPPTRSIHINHRTGQNLTHVPVFHDRRKPLFVERPCTPGDNHLHHVDIRVVFCRFAWRHGQEEYVHGQAAYVAVDAILVRPNIMYVS